MTGGLVQAGEAARSAGQPTQRSHPIKRMCEANHRRRQQYQPIQNSLGVADKVRPGWAKSQEGDAPWNRTAAGSGMGSARWAPPVSQTSQWSGRIVGLSRSQAPTPLESQCLPARRSWWANDAGVGVSGGASLDTQQLAPGKAEKLSRNRRVANATERRRGIHSRQGWEVSAGCAEPDVATRMFHRVSQVKPGVVTQVRQECWLSLTWESAAFGKGGWCCNCMPAERLVCV
eukprot:TRINITY_DN3921_c0_g1_i2.p1 TRINITY_DN3921_c0_g1~~TRINITY_DN3921_c0_g1_i2.p1  ORF type:complete len:231 (+),score=15.34 TRINITY_DN3921_c0_g1_i2:216-908(+)